MAAPVLTGPITWTTAGPDLLAFLENLQGNILKGHGRSDVIYLFCKFDDAAKSEARGFIKEQAGRVQSALQQLQAAADLKKMPSKTNEDPFVSVFLTKEGYDYLGIAQAEQPDNREFQAGMAGADLNDPAPATWDRQISDIHAMIMVGVASPGKVDAAQDGLLAAVDKVPNTRTGLLIGNQFFNGKGHGVENFGYVDGRSQPLVLTEDRPEEDEQGGIDKWPGTLFPVSQFVVPDPAVADERAYGSYFVFRQLEQDVRGFKMREDEINVGHDDDNSTDFKNRDSAGVGRLESGTFYENSNIDPPEGFDLSNNFTFVSNPPRCPHFAHVRKVNPRTDETRKHLMIRRGITYGTRADAVLIDDKRVLRDGTKSEDMPSGGVGLLFQAYQADIGRQFETTQNWANDPGKGGLDPVIGQAQDAMLEWPLLYAGSDTETVNFYRRPSGSGSPPDGGKPGQGQGSYVTLIGGAYFFAPSLAFLKGL